MIVRGELVPQLLTERTVTVDVLNVLKSPVIIDDPCPELTEPLLILQLYEFAFATEAEVNITLLELHNPFLSPVILAGVSGKFSCSDFVRVGLVPQILDAVTLIFPPV